IQVGDAPIDEQSFAATLAYLRPYVEMVEEQLAERLTYFELLTAMALEVFFDRPVHAAVLETGLGGEYDATNVADARVAVVTKVARDHVGEFGDDLQRVAWEKSGIIKPDSVVVTAVDQAELLQVVRERAEERGAKEVLVFGTEVQLVSRNPAVGGQVIAVRGPYGVYGDLFVPLLGPHQAVNAALAVAAVEAFAGEAVDPEAMAEGLRRVRAPGRIEILGRRPLIVCDGGHNPDAAHAVVETLRRELEYGRVLAVFAMLEDKLVEEVLAIIGPACDGAYVAAPASSRAADPQRLASALAEVGVSGTAVTVLQTVPEALAAALGESSDDDAVVIFGSFVAAGEARAWLRERGLLPQS
ncbi:MAG TPA: Mur ligase family protein, partial [Actinomycetota bacterium]|nr:Mur ligase family protein [Actinomycetota bacterium]